MATELTHEHTPVHVSAIFLDPSQPANLRDDENEYVLACVTCGQVIATAPMAA